MRTLSWVLSIGMLVVSAAQAQILVVRDLLTVHPYYPTSSGPLLVQIQDQWPNACAGTLSTQVSADRIDVVARYNTAASCAQVVTPFRTLINARDLAPAGLVFAPEIRVNYSVDNGQGVQLRQTRELSFAESRSILQVTAQTGGWVTPELESSGLFIDQQGDVLSVALFDYDENGRASWHYGSGKVYDDAFEAQLQSFAEISCVTQPCPRAASVHTGRVSIVLLDKNALLVRYHGVLRSTRLDEDRSYLYQRLDFQRSAQLAQIEDSIPVPDLPGNWIAGLRSSRGQPDDFRAVTIRYNGSSGNPPTRSHRFTAFAGANAGTLDSDVVLFNMQCSLASASAPDPTCTISDYAYGNLLCRIDFGYSAVGESRLSSVADCRDNATSTFFSTPFELFRLD